MHRGVYAVGHRPNTEDATWLGAVLACGAWATLSHRSAGALRGLSRDGPLPAVTTSAAAAARHRAPSHEALAEDRTTVRGIAVTSVARTLVDLAHVLDDDGLERAVREAQFRGSVARGADPRRADAALLRAASRLPGRRRADAVGRSRIASCGCAPDIASLVLSHSRGDVRVWTSSGRSSASSSRSTAGRRIAHAWHSSRTARRRTPCNSTAIVVLRFTWEDVNRRPALVAAQVRRALGLEGR